MIRILHCADLHGDNAGTLAGRTVYDETSGLNCSLTNLIDSLDHVYRTAIAPKTRCDLAVLPGDLFDSPRPHANEVMVVKAFVEKLAAEMPVCIIPGNHDLSQNTNDASALETIKGLPNVCIRETPHTVRFVLHNNQPVWVSFLPYPTKGRYLQQAHTETMSPEAVTAEINAALATIVRGLLQVPTLRSGPRDIQILLAHGSVSGSVRVGAQPRSLAHDIQIPLDVLPGFDYVALGHIHQHQQVAPQAWYCGSLLRQSFGEEQEAKGFLIAEVEAEQQPAVQFIKNPCARVYVTTDLATLGTGGVQASKETVVRVKDRLTPEQYELAKPILAAGAEFFPYFQQDIEVVSADRARDAGMAAMLTMEAAIQRVLPDVPADVMQDIFAKHQVLSLEEEAS